MQALVALVVAVIMVVLGTISYATEDLLALINADRSAKGLASLTNSSDLQVFAQLRAEEMMRAETLWHTPTLGATLTNWVVLGENVGRGPTLSAIEAGFMASPTHRANVLRPDFSQAGVGVAWDGVRRFYVAVIFRRVPGVRPTSSPPGTSRPSPTPSPSPGPSPPNTATSPSTALPARPPPSPEPAPVAQPAPAAAEASPYLGWVLEATKGASMVALHSASPSSDAPARTGAEPVASRHTGLADQNGPPSQSLPTGGALLAVMGAWTGVLAAANRRFGFDGPPEPADDEDPVDGATLVRLILRRAWPR